MCLLRSFSIPVNKMNSSSAMRSAGVPVLRTLRSIAFAAAGLFFIMAAISLASPCAQQPLPPVLEKFDPALERIRTVSQAEAYIRAMLPAGATHAQIALAIEDFAARRFLHGYSSFSMCDNWLAYMAGGIWFDLKVPIDADDVLRFRTAICTQNTTVVQALLQRFGIDQSSAVFLGNKHIAPLARIDGRWALYDGDLEPLREGVVFLDEFSGRAFRMYANRTSQLYGEDFATMFQTAANNGGVRIAPPTRAMSVNGRIFHVVTWFFSWFGWAVFLGMGWFLGLLARRARASTGAAEFVASPVALSEPR